MNRVQPGPYEAELRRKYIARQQRMRAGAVQDHGIDLRRGRSHGWRPIEGPVADESEKNDVDTPEKKRDFSWWTVADVKRLEELWGLGLTTKDIAALLKRTEQSIKAKSYRIGLRSGQEREIIAAPVDIVIDPPPFLGAAIREAYVRKISIIEPVVFWRISVQKIQDYVSACYGITRNDMLSSRRTWNLTKPRMVAYYLAKELTLFSFPAIGKLFNGRDHTTILYGHRKTARMRDADPSFDKMIRDMMMVLGADE